VTCAAQQRLNRQTLSFAARRRILRMKVGLCVSRTRSQRRSSWFSRGFSTFAHQPSDAPNNRTAIRECSPCVISFFSFVAVFSHKSGQEINNPWGPKEGGPEGTGKGKVQSTSVPRRGTQALRQRPEGASDPRHGWFFFWTRRGGRDLPLRAPTAAP